MGNYYKAFLPLLSLKTAWFGNKQKKNLSAEKGLDRLHFSAEDLGVVIDRLCFLARSPNLVQGVPTLSCIALSRQTRPYLSLKLSCLIVTL